MTHIFISYSRDDIDFARYLCALLEREGFQIWMDEVQINPGVKWFKEIEQAIQTCAAFIPIMSPSAYESEWVEREILLAESTKKPIFPVLLSGNAWTRLANIQYEDMRQGLHARLSSRFMDGLRKYCLSKGVELTIQHGDITAFESDVIVLKHAQKFLGLDMQVAMQLHEQGVSFKDMSPEPDSYRLVASHDTVQAQQILFIGTTELQSLDYEQIRQLGENALATLAEAAPETRHLAMTIHGPGFGLDESESLRYQIAGFLDALHNGQYPAQLERISIIEFRESRLTHLQAVIEVLFADTPYAKPLPDGAGFFLNPVQIDAAESMTDSQPANTKPSAYVIMSLNAATEDLFYYGIQQTAHAHGLLCEQIEASDLTDDVILQLRQRIEGATVVIADLTDAEPATYLQLGYAWGRKRPAILIAHDQAGVQLRCLRYTSIKHLETLLRAELDDFRANGVI